MIFLFSQYLLGTINFVIAIDLHNFYLKMFLICHIK